MLDVITHNGPCDASSVVATVLIELAYNNVANVKRVNELPKYIDPNWIAVGIGRKTVWHDYDKKNPRYLNHAFPLGPSGLVWLELGDKILKRFGVASEAVGDIMTKAYEDFFAGIDAHYHHVKQLSAPFVGQNYKQSLSLPFCVDQINHATDDYDAAFSAASGAVKLMVKGYLRRLISETEAYFADVDMIQQAHADAYADMENRGYLILERHSSQVNRYLRQNDPLQYFKMVIMPSRDEQHWVIHTVDYRRQQYNTYVKVYSDKVTIHRNRHRAEADTLIDAVTAVEQSLDAYYQWENLGNRVWRYWVC